MTKVNDVDAPTRLVDAVNHPIHVRFAPVQKMPVQSTLRRHWASVRIVLQGENDFSQPAVPLPSRRALARVDRVVQCCKISLSPSGKPNQIFHVVLQILARTPVPGERDERLRRPHPAVPLPRHPHSLPNPPAADTPPRPAPRQPPCHAPSTPLAAWSASAALLDLRTPGGTSSAIGYRS